MKKTSNLDMYGFYFKQISLKQRIIEKKRDAVWKKKIISMCLTHHNHISFYVHITQKWDGNKTPTLNKQIAVIKRVINHLEAKV